ncbi:hypothetical protein FCULG_00012673, partial [Fusarium culmorum]
NSYGSIDVEGWGEELGVGERNLIIHPVCLAFVCRHNNTKPKQPWESFCAENSCHQSHKDDVSNRLLHCIDYFEMMSRAGQGFDYDFPYPKWGTEPRPESLEEQWLLYRSTNLPITRRLQLTAIQKPTSPVGIKIFGIPGFLTLPGSCLVGNRQDLFLSAVRNFGLMLLFTLADWADNDWSEVLLKDASLFGGSKIDWWAYMLDYIGKTNPHIHNRWRLHKMAVQLARGRNGHRFEKKSTCAWNAGSLRFKPDSQKLDAKGWEVDVDWWGGSTTERKRTS